MVNLYRPAICVYRTPVLLSHMLASYKSASEPIGILEVVGHVHTWCCVGKLRL